MKFHNYGHKETKMLIAGRYVKNALVWISRAMRRKQISDEEREAMEEVLRLIIETDMAFVHYCNKYIYNGNPMRKQDQEVEDAFGKGEVTEE